MRVAGYLCYGHALSMDEERCPVCNPALQVVCDYCGAALAFEEHAPDCRAALEEGSNEQSTYDDLVYDQSVFDYDAITFYEGDGTPTTYEDDLYEVIDMERATWIAD